MPEQPNQNQKPSASEILRRGDQLLLAALALAGLAGIFLVWICQGGGSGRLVEIDRADSPHVSFQVDVNSAAWPELAQLPGIGQTLARRIVEERRRGGPFEKIEDVPYRVPGIGPKKFEAMRRYLIAKPTSRRGTAAAEP
jgi:competence protein ComEA